MSTKYKFEEVTGCTAFDFLVNGKSLSDIAENDPDQCGQCGDTVSTTIWNI